MAVPLGFSGFIYSSVGFVIPLYNPRSVPDSVILDGLEFGTPFGYKLIFSCEKAENPQKRAAIMNNLVFIFFEKYFYLFF